MIFGFYGKISNGSIVIWVRLPPITVRSVFQNSGRLKFYYTDGHFKLAENLNSYCLVFLPPNLSERILRHQALQGSSSSNP